MTRECPVRIREGGEVRFLSATRLVMGFEREDDARRMLSDLGARLAKFGLSLHEDKTRLIMFGKFAAERRAQKGMGRPESFDFLGYVSSALMLCCAASAQKMQGARKIDHT
jgi:hypothetical protein